MAVTDFSNYQTEARKTRMEDSKEYLVVYSALGLAGEAGELANKAKKILRGDKNRDELIAGIKSEMGDVLWYLAALADDLDVSLADIAQENIDKIQSRYKRGAITGGGDNR